VRTVPRKRGSSRGFIDTDLDVETPIVYPDGRIFDYDYETRKYVLREPRNSKGLRTDQK